MIQRRSATVLLAGLLLLAGAVSGCSGDAGDDAQSQAPAVAATPTIVPAEQRWWDDRTFYEIFVRSFADSDGDGIGDLQGVIDRLDYLNDGDPATTTDLGVTGIWLMPIFESPTYHGYGVTDYRTIDADYGTMDDFEALLAAAHERGINVILDYPLNHTSIDHPWFQGSRTGEGQYADWYVWIDGTSQEKTSWGAEVWHPDGDRSYLGIFDPNMPDLNLRNPAVTAELADIARFWLAEVGIDGFRLDGVKHLIEEEGQFETTAADKEWLAAFNASVKSVDPGALLVGEIWTGSIISSGYVPGQVDIAFDFDTADDAATLASSGLADSLLMATENNLSNYPEWQVAVFTDNHDRPRLGSLAADDLDRLRMIATWQLTQPGTPFLYYGQEIGLPGVKSDEPTYDETIRTPMPWTGDAPAAGFTTGEPWTALQPGWEQRNVDAQRADPDSQLNQVAALVAVRNATPALRTGDFTMLEVDAPDGFAYLRTLDDERVLVLGNADDEPVEGMTVTLPEGIPAGQWTSIFGAEVAQPDGTAYQPVATLGPWETVIARLG